MKLSIQAGATSQSINIYVLNSASSTGAGLSGLTYNSSGLTAYYSFSGVSATSSQITLATLATVASAWSAGGFIQIDATNMPGWYRLDLPNAVLASGNGQSVSLHLQGAAGMAPTPIEIEITAWNNQDGVHGGLTCLPNTAVSSNGSLVTSGSGMGQLLTSSGAVLLQPTQTGVTIPSVTTVGSVAGSVGSVTGNVGGNVGGSVASVTSPVNLNLAQTLNSARALDSIVDTSLTVNDALHNAIAESAGQWYVSAGALSWTKKTPYSGTTLRTFTIDSATAPTQRV